MKITDEQYLERLKDILNKHRCQYFRILKRKENDDLLKWINIKTPLLANSYYRISTKVFWILNGIKEFPRRKNPNCNKEMRQNVGQGSRGYREYCCQRCAGLCSCDKVQTTKEIKYGDKHYVNREKAIQTNIKIYGAPSNMQSEKGKAEYLAGLQKKYGSNITNIFQTDYAKEQSKKTKKEKYGDENYHNTEKQKETLRKRSKEEITASIKKAEQTRLKRYGYRYPMQNLDNRILIRRAIYKYNGILFDSKEEVALFIWLTDMNKDFKYHSGDSFEYYFDGNIHKYFPDFKVDNEFWEIKGDHFFKNTNYRMSTPYAKKENDNMLFEAKYDCMIKNGVKILKTSNPFIISCVEYVKKKFGYNFFKDIKVKKCKKNECK